MSNDDLRLANKILEKTISDVLIWEQISMGTISVRDSAKENSIVLETFRFHAEPTGSQYEFDLYYQRYFDSSDSSAYGKPRMVIKKDGEVFKTLVGELYGDDLEKTIIGTWDYLVSSTLNTELKDFIDGL